MKDGDLIIALENGIFKFDDSKIYDICMMYVLDSNNESKYYYSVGIEIDKNIYDIYSSDMSYIQIY